VHFEKSVELVAKVIDAVGVAVIVVWRRTRDDAHRAIQSRLGSAVPRLPARPETSRVFDKV
jgi:hypothetical protein